MTWCLFPSLTFVINVIIYVYMMLNPISPALWYISTSNSYNQTCNKLQNGLVPFSLI
jgi:hypothetical protein